MENNINLTCYMKITLENINELQKDGLSVILSRLILGNNTRPRYSLEEPLHIELSDKSSIIIPKGFTWDLSSTPRMLWWLLPPSSDAELGTIIHDYLYIFKDQLGYSRKFADKEMLLWSKAVSGTNSKVSLRNFDNWVRYAGVRLFGGFVWRKKQRTNLNLEI